MSLSNKLRQAFRRCGICDEDFLLLEAADWVDKLEEALKRIRDCNWVITLPDRMDAVRAIAREALE